MSGPDTPPPEPLSVPPMVEFNKQPVMIRAWRRADLDGSWWALLSWLAKEQLPFGEPEYELVERWVHNDHLRPLEGQDYSTIPRVTM